MRAPRRAARVPDKDRPIWLSPGGVDHAELLVGKIRAVGEEVMAVAWD